MLGILVALFIAVFALDAFESGEPLVRALLDVGLHMVPSIGLLVLVVLSWRRAWIGGAAFVALALAYALSVRERPEWILVVSGPLLAAGMLFLWAWAEQRRAHT